METCEIAGKYLVYEVKFPDGTVYIGRTGLSLEARIAAHYEDAASGDRPINKAFAKWPHDDIHCKVLWSGNNYYQCQGKEIRFIRKWRLTYGRNLLNRTRGGFYDPYDAGIAVTRAKLDRKQNRV